MAKLNNKWIENRTICSFSEKKTSQMMVGSFHCVLHSWLQKTYLVPTHLHSVEPLVDISVSRGDAIKMNTDEAIRNSIFNALQYSIALPLKSNLFSRLIGHFSTFFLVRVLLIVVEIFGFLVGRVRLGILNIFGRWFRCLKLPRRKDYEFVNRECGSLGQEFRARC